MLINALPFNYCYKDAKNKIKINRKGRKEGRKK